MPFSVLEDPETRKLFVPISLESYHWLVKNDPDDYEKTELIEGVIIKKMTKSAGHSFYANLFYERIRELLPEGTIILKENPMEIADSEPEPDIAVVAGDIFRYRNENPKTAILIVEVSLTSLASDRQKIPIYALGGVENYWIVNLNTKEVEAYSKLEGGKYTFSETYSADRKIPIFNKELDLKEILAV